MTVDRRVADAESGDDLVAQSAIGEISARGAAFGRGAELRGEKSRRRLVHAREDFAVPRRGVRNRVHGTLLELDPGFLGHALERLGERDAFNHHHELEDVAADAAAEAMEDLFLRMNVE